MGKDELWSEKESWGDELQPGDGGFGLSMEELDEVIEDEPLTPMALACHANPDGYMAGRAIIEQHGGECAFAEELQGYSEAEREAVIAKLSALMGLSVEDYKVWLYDGPLQEIAYKRQCDAHHAAFTAKLHADHAARVAELAKQKASLDDNEQPGSSA